MGVIKQRESEDVRHLEPEHVVGRAWTSSLVIHERFVSAQHAVLRWTGDRWELKDLGSRNGTFLDGTRITPGESHVLHKGARMAFGKVEHEWELVDDTGPSVMAAPRDGGPAALLDGDFIVLPSHEDPRVTIYRTADGGWCLEHPDRSVTPITHLQTFELDGREWKFCCPAPVTQTSLADPVFAVQVQHLQLAFSVARDEEHVQLRVTSGGRSTDLGTRGHNYLLLTLARRRLADAAEGQPETSCGWIYQEDLVGEPSMAPPQLNINVFRIRRQFAALGLVDAGNIIERRPRTKQLRIGTGRITITSL